jgi:hypothetical protein
MSAPEGFALAPVRRAARPAPASWRDVPPDAEARALDNAVLTAVRLRRWMASPDVAREVGQSPEWVRKVTADVEAHDMATPDPRATAEDMRAAYAWHKGRKA